MKKPKAFCEEAYEDLTYAEAIEVFENQLNVIDPALILAARRKAIEALKIMAVKSTSKNHSSYNAKEVRV